MTSQIRPQLSHCGVYACDIDTMVAFYTKTIGLVVSDRGVSGRGGELAFMTAAPGHHHQLVIVSGRAPEGVSTVNQLSFKVSGLDQLKGTHRRVRDAGVTGIRQTSHGNALSIYFPDPEGNMVEIYMDTQWYVPQPHSIPIDLSLPNDEIMAQTEKHCRETAGFMPLEEWQAEVERRLQLPANTKRRGTSMTELKGYHAHVYYDTATRPAAERLREAIINQFAVKPGAFSDEPIGPHPISQFSVIFETEEFRNIVPWLMLNREGLDVLVHPLTESSYDDHSKNALWLGTPVPMRLEILRPTYSAGLLPTAAA